MKKIEKLIKEAKNDYVGLVIPKDLIDIAIKYFNDKYLTEYIDDLTEDEKRELVIDFSNRLGGLDYGLAEWYKDHNYKLITLTKEDFEDITEDTNAAKSAVDNRTLLIVHKNTLAINDVTDDVYFNDDEAVQFLSTVITNVYTIIPTYGKSLELKPHISIY